MSSGNENARLQAPATVRNREPIFAVLAEHLPKSGQVLEVASGTGQHVAYFAERMREVRWLPSDPDPESRASIAAWTEGLPNVDSPLDLDTTAQHWNVPLVDGMFCANMIHIAPWTCCLGLVAKAGVYLRPDGLLFLYGPFKQDGAHTSAGNERFDAELRLRHPEWGIRDVEAVSEAAVAVGLTLHASVSMPANNLTIIFRR